MSVSNVESPYDQVISMLTEMSYDDKTKVNEQLAKMFRKESNVSAKGFIEVFNALI
jgi:hypothetical protein